MGAIITTEALVQQAEHMPEALLREVLDFMGYLRMKYNLPPVNEWDAQIEEDGESGAFAAAFDSIADVALKEHKEGRTTPL